MDKTEMYAQGDLLFVRTRANVASARLVTDGVLATGEGSGHTHRLRPGQQAAVLLMAGIMYVEAKRQAVVEHVVLPSESPTGEHADVTLPEGLWEVRRQREWTPEGYRQVID